MTPLPIEKDTPLTDAAPPLPDAQPLTLPVVDTVTDPAAELERERQAAYAGTYHWRGQELLPFSMSRKSLWEKLCLHDLPLPPVLEHAGLEIYLPRAIKLIYLLTHDVASYRHLRASPGQFIEVIEAWQDEHTTAADTIDIVTLALDITNAASATIAIPAPTKGAPSGE